MAVADTMRAIKLEKEETVGEYRGADAFSKLLSKAMDKAIAGIPLTNCSSTAVTFFLRSTYDRVSWRSTAGKAGVDTTADPGAPPKNPRGRPIRSDRRERQRLAKKIRCAMRRRRR